MKPAQKPDVALEIKIIDAERSIQCIHALDSVMRYFTGPEGLSASGKDRQAVYTWFVARHKPGVDLLGIKE